MVKKDKYWKLPQPFGWAFIKASTPARAKRILTAAFVGLEEDSKDIGREMVENHFHRVPVYASSEQEFREARAIADTVIEPDRDIGHNYVMLYDEDISSFLVEGLETPFGFGFFIDPEDPESFARAVEVLKYAMEHVEEDTAPYRLSPEEIERLERIDPETQ